MKTITLSDDQFSTLVNGLQTAAKKFEANATAWREKAANVLDSAIGRRHAEEYNALASQFEKQAKETWALSYVFNGASKVEVFSE